MVRIATSNVGRAGHGARVQVLEADAAALPLPDASFDLVVSTFSMHHWGEVRSTVTELARVLRPGGTLWIYDLRRVDGDPLTAAAGEAFAGQPLTRTVPRTGRFPLRLYARWAVTRLTSAAPTQTT